MHVFFRTLIYNAQFCAPNTRLIPRLVRFCSYCGVLGHDAMMGPCNGSGPGSIPGQTIWHWCWEDWHWDRVFFEYLRFTLSVSVRWCSVFINPSIADYIQGYS